MADIPFDRALKASQLSGEDIANLTPAERKSYEDLQRRIVYGHDSKTDHDDNPIEQGLGSAAQPTRNSIEAYKRWHKSDPDYKGTLAAMEAQYAEHIAAKKAPKRKAG